MLTMVAAGQGISLLPVTMGRFLTQGITIRPLPGRPCPTLDHTFVYQKTHPAPPLADFVRLLQGVRERSRS